jgi:hypothetical protein
MPYYPNPTGGAPIQADTNPNPNSGGGSYGYYSAPGYNGPPPPTGGGSNGSSGSVSGAAGSGGQLGGDPTITQQTGSGQSLAAGINSLLGAVASGNRQAFEEQVREFNATFGLNQDQFNQQVSEYNQNLAVTQAGLTGQYNGQQTQAAQLQAANLAAQRAGLTGYYQDPSTTSGPTQAAYLAARTTQLQGMGFDPAQAAQTALSEWNQGLAQSGNVAGGMPPSLVSAAGPGTPTMAYQQQQYAQQMGAVTAAASMQANPFRQAQVIGQAGRILQGMPTAGFQAPTTVAGVGTAGGNTQGGMGYLSQLISDIQDPTANQTTAQSWLDATPTPNKIDSSSFLRASPTTQNLILQSMQEKFGLDPTDSLKQIQNTLPQFSAPNTTGTVRRG